jgi:hypothetical protein
MKSLEKNIQTEILDIKSSLSQIGNTIESHSSRLEQVKEFQDSKTKYIKKKRILRQKHKSCKRNMQELCNSIKRPNLQIRELKKVKRCKQKVWLIYSTKISQILRKLFPFRYKKPAGHQTDMTKNRASLWHIIVKTISTENKERILKAAREKNQITYKGKHIKITADFLAETLKERRSWNEVFWALKENNFSSRILYPAKLSFKIERGIKIFHDKQKLKQYTTTKPPLQKILKGILHTEDENKHSHEMMGIIKP